MTARLGMVLYWGLLRSGMSLRRRLPNHPHHNTFGEGGWSWFMFLNIFFGVPTVLSYLAGRAAR
jgi:hypothetical protein